MENNVNELGRNDEQGGIQSDASDGIVLRHTHICTQLVNDCSSGSWLIMQC